MISLIGTEAAQAEKMEPPWLETTKWSGQAVKWKFRAFATQKELKRGDKVDGVIRNRLNSHEPPTAKATMEWKVERIESKKAAPGDWYSTPAELGAGEGSCMVAAPSGTREGVGTLSAREGWISALGAPIAKVPIIEGTEGSLGTKMVWTGAAQRWREGGEG
jgi:hypothetical protein